MHLFLTLGIILMYSLGSACCLALDPTWQHQFQVVWSLSCYLWASIPSSMKKKKINIHGNMVSVRIHILSTHKTFRIITVMIWNYKNSPCHRVSAQSIGFVKIIGILSKISYILWSKHFFIWEYYYFWKYYLHSQPLELCFGVFFFSFHTPHGLGVFFPHWQFHINFALCILKIPNFFQVWTTVLYHIVSHNCLLWSCRLPLSPTPSISLSSQFSVTSLALILGNSVSISDTFLLTPQLLYFLLSHGHFALPWF